MSKERQFSKRAQKVLLLANLESERLHCSRIASEHLLLGALAYRSPGVGGALRKAGLGVKQLRQYLAQLRSAPEPAPRAYAPSMKRALQRSDEHAEELSAREIEAEHLLLAVLDETEGAAARALQNFGVDLGSTRRLVLRQLGC